MAMQPYQNDSNVLFREDYFLCQWNMTTGQVKKNKE